MSKIDLTEGPISKKLFKLALPIILTGFMETTYNLIDMFWIGRLGTKEVAGVGTAGFYIWLSAGFILLTRTGTEIKVAEKTGEKDEQGAKEYARIGIILSIIIGALYSLCMIIFRKNLIGIFNFDDENVVRFAINYLIFVTPGIFFSFVSKSATGAFNGRGNTAIAFKANVIGLIANIVLDPLLIFGIGSINSLGVIGAGLATSISQGISLLVFIYYIKVKKSLFDNFKLFKRLDFGKIKQVLKLGLPTAIYNGIFTIVSMILAIIIAKYGAEAIAAQKVGAQIESISWMTSLGFATAIGAFTAQNVGANKYDRVLDGYKEAIKISFLLGMLNTLILFFGSSFLVTIFFKSDIITQEICKEYLQIIAISQIFMCIEITTTGAFNGLSKTTLPAVTSTVFNLLRIPLSIFLTSYIGVSGVWLAITISSILKGVFMVIFFITYIQKDENFRFRITKSI